MALKKISQLNSITGAQITASVDVLAVVNEGETKKITVSGLHSGSFSGSFQGDGSGITGVTGEWDGSHLGDASITGSLVVTQNITGSNISASGTVIGNIGTFTTLTNVNTTNITASGNVSSSAASTASFGTYLGDGSQLTGVTSEWDGTRNGNAEITGSLVVTQNITGSNISASGIVYGETGSFSHIQGNSPFTVGDSVTFQQDITASGNIILNDSTNSGLSSTNKITAPPGGGSGPQFPVIIEGGYATNGSGGKGGSVYIRGGSGVASNSTGSVYIDGDVIINNTTTSNSSTIISGSLFTTNAIRSIGTENSPIASFSLYYTGSATTTDFSTALSLFSATRQGSGTDARKGRITLRDLTSTKNSKLTAQIKSSGDSFIGGGGLLIGESYEFTDTTTYNLELDADSAGKPNGGSWANSSDERLKENIETASLDICYDTVKNIPLKRYTWKESTYQYYQSPDRSVLGWMAQDVQPHFPKSVTTSSFITWATYTGSLPITGSYTGSVEEGIPPKILYPGNKYQDVLAGSTIYEDSLVLNETQMMRMLYGAVQKLQQKVETLEAQISGSTP